MEVKNMYRCILVLVLVGLVPLGAQSAAKSYSCKAPAQIQDAITQAGPGGIESLLAKYPGDFWVRRAFIDSRASGGSMAVLRSSAGIPGGPAAESVIAQFQKDFANRPEDPEAAYLYAYALVHRDTGKSVEILTSLVQKAPDVPAALLTLAILHTYPNWYDQAKVRKYTENYMARCPDTFEPRIASLAAQLDRSDVLIAYAKGLRARIAGKTDEETLSQYPALWQLESKIALPAEAAEFKKRIEGDLQFLEGLDKTRVRIANAVLMQGYQRTGNTEALDRINKDSTVSSSISTASQSTAFLRAQSEWIRSNPPPASTAIPEERTAYHKKQLQFLDEWRDKMPQNSTLLALRFAALTSLPETTNEILVREGSLLLAAMRSQSAILSVSASLNIFDVLQVWAKRGLELDLIPSLVQEAVDSQARMYALQSSTQQSDLFYGGPYQTLQNEDRTWKANTGAWTVLLTIHIKKQQLDQARSILAAWEKALNERRKKAEELKEKLAERSRSATASERSSYNPISSMESSLVSGIPSDESRYYHGCAQLAAAEGRTLDALTYYQSSLRLMYGRSSSASLAELEAAKEADVLWKQLGGSQPAWPLWLDSIKTIPAPKIVPQRAATNRAIPKFSATDQNGKTWTPDDLKGKTTLINVWATWCGPCQRELPLLQQLYEQVKDRKDIRVITLNVDQDQSLVRPYLQKNKFSFPALFAESFVREFAGPIGIPTTWISDVTGTIRSEELGFGGDSLGWIPQTLKKIENVRAAAK
jgi:thiol-disulfide isomerase/thioredoxin